MAPDMEKPQVTEIKVRMDCNGCVQKIKKALQGVPGIHDIYVDFQEQKVTITGWAEPEKLVKAIKKTRKSAVICVHTEESEPPEAETPPEEEAPPPESTNSRAEPLQTEAAPPPEPPLPENPPPATSQHHHHHPQRPNNLEEVHVVYHHPPQRGYGGPWNEYQVRQGFRNEEPYQPPQFVYASPGPHANPYRPSPLESRTPHGNTYRPSPHTSPGFRDEEPHQPSQPIYMGPGPHANPNRPSPHESRPPHVNTYSPSLHTSPGFRDEEPYQPSQPIYTGSGPHANPNRPSPLESRTPNVNTYRPSLHVSPGFRDEEPYQPSQPIYMGSGPQAGPGFRDGPVRPANATHSYNTHNPSLYVTGYAYPSSTPKYPTSNSADVSREPGLRDEGEPSQPVYATNRYQYNVYRPSPYVSEYAYPESPPRYSSYSYNRDYYSENYEHGNVSSMFSEENPNACRIV